jgi:exosortase family protein XrtG
MTTLFWLVPAVMFWAVVVRFFWKAGAWLPHYVLAAAGSALFAVVFARNVLPLETALRAATAFGVNVLANGVGIHTTIANVATGSLLVVGVPHHEEWTNLSIGLECSGLLESAVLLGLVGFFPAYTFRRRMALVVVALAATLVANVLRMMVIVAAVAMLGQDWLDFAHVVLGRVAFFGMAVIIYWYAITRPTLQTVALRLKGSH